MDRLFVKNFLKALFSSSFGTLATVLFHFLSITVIVKHAPMEEFGIYMLILAVAHGLRIVSGLGLDLTLVKFISGEEKKYHQETFSTILLTRVMTALAISGLILIGARSLVSLFDQRLQSYIIYLPVLCALTSLKELLFHFFQGSYLFKKYALLNIFSAGIKFILIFLWAWQSRVGLKELIHIEIATLALCLAMQSVALPSKSFNRLQLNRGAFKRVMTFGFPLYLNNILTFVYERTNIFIIGALLNPINIALYEVATKIPEGIHRLFSSFIAVYFPSLSKLLSEKNTNGAFRVMNQCLTFLSCGSIFLALGAFLFKEEIITLLFSKDYLPAAPALALFMLNVQITFVSYTMGYTLVSAGYSSLPFKINAVSSALNIAANLLLIPAHGFIGAVYASLIMNVAATLMNHYFMRRAGFSLSLIKYFVPLIAFLSIAGLFQVFSLNLMYAKILAIGLYSAICLAYYQELRSALRSSGKIFSLILPASRAEALHGSAMRLPATEYEAPPK
jgi:O-antigen/teichoic acid export membrane protein